MHVQNASKSLTIYVYVCTLQLRVYICSLTILVLALASDFNEQGHNEDMTFVHQHEV
jgi:hypothetical protein